MARQAVLRVLFRHGTVSLSDLVPAVTAATGASSPARPFESRKEAARSLHHLHIPRLEACGLLSVDREAGTRLFTLHPDVRDGPLTARLLRSVGQDVWTAIATVLRDRQRSEVLAALARSGPTLTLEQVSEALAGSSTGAVVGRGASHNGCEHVMTALHHLHLPKLDEAGLVSYDPTDHELSYAGHRWFRLADLVDALESRTRRSA